MLGDFRGHFTTSKYAKLAKCSTDTALRDIREPLERGIVAQSAAGGRSTSYRLAEPAADAAFESPRPALAPHPAQPGVHTRKKSPRSGRRT